MRNPDSFKSKSNLGIGIGIVLMFTGAGFAKNMEGPVPLGPIIWSAGMACLILGCVNYMRWKGYSGWFGLFAYLFLPGLVILVCFPNRRKRILQRDQLDISPEAEALMLRDQTPGYQYLLTLAPLGLVLALVTSLALIVQSKIRPVEWKQFASAEIGFQALMPGTPREEKQTQQTPAGKVEVHKFLVEPQGKKELYFVVSMSFPESVGRQIGGPAKLLELGRKDLLSASQAEVVRERQFVVDGRPALELELLPPKGATMKARIYVTSNRIYQVCAHVPKIRGESEDVQKFLDSFKLSAKPAAAAASDRPATKSGTKGERPSHNP
jgi:hypothetical protein